MWNVGVVGQMQPHLLPPQLWGSVRGLCGHVSACECMSAFVKEGRAKAAEFRFNKYAPNPTLTLKALSVWKQRHSMSVTVHEDLPFECLFFWMVAHTTDDMIIHM